MAVFLLGQRLRPKDVVATALGYGGVLIIATGGDLTSLRVESPRGVLLALSSTVVWAWYWLCNARNPNDPVVSLCLNNNSHYGNGQSLHALTVVETSQTRSGNEPQYRFLCLVGARNGRDNFRSIRSATIMRLAGASTSCLRFRLVSCYAWFSPAPPRLSGTDWRRRPMSGCLKVTVRSCRYFGPEVAAARRSVRPVPDRACGSASVHANRVAMRFQCPTPFLTLAITPLRSASIAIWQALRTAPYRHNRTVTFEMGITFVLWSLALHKTSHISRIANLIFLAPLFSLVLIHNILGETVQYSTLWACR